MNSLEECFVDTKKKSSSPPYDVILNGKIVGFVSTDRVEELTKRLRYLKAMGVSLSGTNESPVPKYLEICHLPHSVYSLYPGLYLFTTPGRMMRPVRNLQTQAVEYIGSLEQCYLHICINPEEFVEKVISAGLR